MDFFNYDFIISKIVLACKVLAGTGNKIHNNRPSHGLALNISGVKNYKFYDGKEITVKENDIIYLPKNSSYIVDDIIPGDCYAINFDITECITFPPFSVHLKNPEKSLEDFKTATKAFTSKQVGYISKCKSALYDIIYSVVFERSLAYSPDKIRDSLMPAINYIHKSYTKEVINIDYLSELCNMSQTYFRKLFHDCFAVSPIKYINGLKLTRAKELISQNEFSLETVSEMSGFNNVYYFCRFFKKNVGMTPTEYKKYLLL